MQSLTKMVFVACLLSCPHLAVGQNADPFAAPADPFGGAASADPFAPGKQKATSAQRQRTGVGGVSKVAVGSKSKSGDNAASLAHIRAALDGLTTQQFIDLPLQDAVLQIAQGHDIPIVVDRRALDEIGLSPDEPVTIGLRNVTLRAFLRLMLREHELTYIIKDEVMQITTEEAAERSLVVEMYKIPEELVDKSDKILMALKSAVVPAAWDTSGGPCTVSAIDDVMIVSANERIHEDVREFLVKLERAFEKHKARR